MFSLEETDGNLRSEAQRCPPHPYWTADNLSPLSPPQCLSPAPHAMSGLHKKKQYKTKHGKPSEAWFSLVLNPIAL